jgi:starch phosphorylase
MPEFANRIVFVEDYDHYDRTSALSGLRPVAQQSAASTRSQCTSGMKLPPSGGLNLSVLDGWWCEAYAQNKKIGLGHRWRNPESTEIINPKFEDEVDVASLFHILETQIVPLYYAKPDGRLPLAWIQLMRESIRTVVPAFNTHRMVREYTERLYEPAARANAALAAGSGKKAVELSKWKDAIRKAWPEIKISDVRVENSNVTVGESLMSMPPCIWGRSICLCDRASLRRRNPE